MTRRAVTVNAHAMLALMAYSEYKLAEGRLRRFGNGLCCGWHLAAMVFDWLVERPAERIQPIPLASTQRRRS